MKPTVSYEDFAKLDLRVARVDSVEEIEGADKLYKLTISLGDEVRTICAGIKEFYSLEELKGKKIIVVANLEPRKLRGVESKGMLLAAGSDETNECVLLVPDKDIGPGARVS